MKFNTLKLTTQTSLRALAGAIALILTTGAILPAIAQQSTNLSMQMAQASRLNGNWKLLNMTTAGSPMPMLPIANKVPTVQFSGNRVAGTGGCNRFMGGFTTSGNTLSIGPLGSTMMACEQGVMQQETMFLTALQGAQTYEISSDGILTISYQNEQGTGVLRFASEAVRALW